MGVITRGFLKGVRAALRLLSPSVEREMTNSLFIHIGTHKTGSTAIQQALRMNSTVLRSDDLVLLEVPDEILRLISSPVLDDERVERCRRELVRLKDARRFPNARFVMTSEGFSGESDLGYANAELVAEALSRTTKDFLPWIIVYIRRQDELVESLYAQSIQEGGSHSFEEFVSRLPEGSFDWAAFLDCFSRRFGKQRMIVRRYDRRFLPDRLTLINDFGQVIGSTSLMAATDVITPNRSYSRDALEIARIANPHLDERRRKRLRSILQRTSSKEPFEPHTFWSEWERREFMSRYEESNARVAREYFGHDDGPSLFSPSQKQASNYREYPGLTTEASVLLLVGALLDESEDVLWRAWADKTFKARQKLWRMLCRFPKAKAAFERLRRNAKR